MDTNATEAPIIPGTPFAGGFYAGRILVGGRAHLLVVAPKADGERDDAPLLTSAALVAGASSFNDGRANTAALAEAGSELARWAQGLRIGGFDDWYLPARDELEILYRAFKPTADENFCGSGDNPSADPVTWAYSRDVPPRTVVASFAGGEAEAFESTWYWSSTQYAGDESSAWYQTFDSGCQGDNHKDDGLRARAVRRLKV